MVKQFFARVVLFEVTGEGLEICSSGEELNMISSILVAIGPHVTVIDNPEWFSAPHLQFGSFDVNEIKKGAILGDGTGNELLKKLIGCKEKLLECLQRNEKLLAENLQLKLNCKVTQNDTTTETG